MDGSKMTRTTALGHIIESGMRQKSDFNVIRRQVAEFLKKNGCFGTGTERIGNQTYVIMVTYWDATGKTRSESFEEWPSYTKSQPVTTW